MVFDLNCWHDKAYNTDDRRLRQKYFELANITKENLLNEHELFKNMDKSRKCHINEKYLDEIYTFLLTGEIYVPPTLLLYIINKYDLPNGTYKKLIDLFFEKGWTRSIGIAARIIHSQYSTLYAPQLLMFEVWEFTLTYPEFKELFVEGWV